MSSSHAAHPVSWGEASLCLSVTPALLVIACDCLLLSGVSPASVLLSVITLSCLFPHHREEAAIKLG